MRKSDTTIPLMLVMALVFLIAEAFILVAKPMEVEARTMKITAYCGCRKCNGKWYGQSTASGTDYKEGRTIAVDKHQIPLGTHVWINGHEYIAEDTGNRITWDCIDIYFDDHQEAKKFGVKYMDVEW